MPYILVLQNRIVNHVKISVDRKNDIGHSEFAKPHQVLCLFGSCPTVKRIGQVDAGEILSKRAEEPCYDSQQHFYIHAARLEIIVEVRCVLSACGIVQTVNPQKVTL